MRAPRTTVIASAPRWAGWFVSVAVTIGLHADPSLAHDHLQNCAAATQHGLSSARQAVERAPRELTTRFSLVDLLVDAGCYDEAVHVLEDGQSIYPRNDEIKQRLRTARSLMSERQFFEGLDQAEQEAKLSRHVLRCTRFIDVGACDQALALKPNDLTIVLAKGDALLKVNQPIEALEVYNRAAALDPSSATVAAKVQAAQALRAALGQQCMKEEGDGAVRACTAILRKDAPDEFDLRHRIALLYQTANQPSMALDAYIAANTLRRGDRAVALAIVALVDSTGRSDAIALAARGSSLVTLGRAREGIGSMQQARALAPELPGIEDQIASAERLLKQEDRMRESQRSSKVEGAAAQGQAAKRARTYSNVQPASHAN